MYVLATAGHVDHGKSTLVRALTGMEPDRWSEERRRGMTIDLGYAWTTLADGRQLAFVDVPGHERFIGNMLAGLGPVGAVMFVVAADEGWREQSAEHLLAVDALGLDVGLLVVTRSDLADPTSAIAVAREQLSRSSLGEVPAVAVSGRTGAGLPELRTALLELTGRLPEPAATGRVRLWIDRSFSIRGSGTVVTGTLAAGTLRVGEELDLAGRAVRIRGLQTLSEPRESVSAVARVAVNLRSIASSEIRRGDVLTTPGAWRPSSVVEVRMPTELDMPTELTVHIGTAALPARARPLGSGVVRLTLRSAIPVQPGDRVILQDQTTRRVLTGAIVLDIDPPELTRRGAAGARGRELATGTPSDGHRTVLRRGAISVQDLLARGETVSAPDVLQVGKWWISTEQRDKWARALRAACEHQRVKDPLRPVLSTVAAVRAIGLPDEELLAFVAGAAALSLTAGTVHLPGVTPSLGAAEPGLVRLEERLRAAPFAAPDRPLLSELGLGPKELAAAVALGRLLRLDAEVLLLPDAPARAMRTLAALPQPFTTSQARQAWNTTRRVAIPLLEQLDRRGWTRRINGDQRAVVTGR